MDRRLTRENVIGRTCYGTNVYSYILQQFYPNDFLMKVSGDDCGWNRNPWDNSNPTLHIFTVKADPDAKLSPHIARHHDASGHIPDGNFFDFAEFYFKKSGEELLQLLNDQLHLHLLAALATTAQKNELIFELPRFSFFKAPIRNTIPYRQITLHEVWKYVTGRYARARTDNLRTIRDPRRARLYKAESFDYCTFSGTFSVRKEDKLQQHSGLLCLDFDHLDDIEALFEKLLHDEYFETQMLFRSPSGDGLKWIIPVDLTECGHADYFRSVAAYILETYGVEVDQSGKDVCRACFLPYDPRVYVHPQYQHAV